MDFRCDPDDERFRLEVRSFIAAHLPPEVAARRLTAASNRRDIVFWTRTLKRKGWLTPHWPAEWGGAKLSVLRRYILREECVAANCPDTDAIALDMAGPVIHTFGSAELKKRYLPAMLDAEELWCQGFSESHAGSDPFELRTVAVRNGNYYAVNGRKLWTTRAHLSDMMFALVRIRLGEKVQHGLTFVLINMHSSGITVRPVITIDGRHVVNEVTLEDVRVPVNNVVGEEGKGWIYARSLLGNERIVVAAVPQTKRDLDRLKSLAARKSRFGCSMLDNPIFRAKLAQIEVDFCALEFLNLRVLHAEDGDRALDGLAPVLKIRGGELRQRVCELTLEALGESGVAYHPKDGVQNLYGNLSPPESNYVKSVLADFMSSRTVTIAGGTTEIQRNIIAGVALQM
jgi:alkylation response protein AidB-like acyl-CoA dehydrogenase